ncbi:MAG: carboxypeptidase-like regulatory domain-containing protein, partial [Bacteroidota bacterium]
MKLHYLLLPFLLCCFSYTMGQVEVSGQVIREDTGEPLPGVTIREQGTANGTLSNIDGTYSLKISGENATLVFSYFGSADYSVTYSGQTEINVKMSEEITNVDEVMIVGYGTQKKSVVTGAISKV